ncbi:hypothetical protein HanXRQr2_Chr04g0140431 [Helianthus annuus]|uniref:Uncharacterized protein n=1 Tax=Helianthus annuus TaxID=4232 RepID=A0A9K3J395_HELAN|nr:hypothetical protein HanXRQr2_Chr04g0140431 [Helianthus annuus]
MMKGYEVTAHIKKPVKSLHQFSGSSNLQLPPLRKRGVNPFGILRSPSWRYIQPFSILVP